MDFSTKIDFLKLNELKRHILLCADQTNAKCCQHEAGLESWDYLKNRLRELGLSEKGAIYREKNPDDVTETS